MRPLVSQSGTDKSPLTTLCNTSAKADCAEESAFHQKVWMQSSPGTDQLFAFFKAFLSLVSSMLSGPSEEVLPTPFLVSFSHSFTTGSSWLTLPTVPKIYVQKSLTTSIVGALLEVGTLPFIRNFLWVFLRWFCSWNFQHSADLRSFMVQTLNFPSVCSRALISTFRFNEWNSLLSFLRIIFLHLVIGLLFC